MSDSENPARPGTTIRQIAPPGLAPGPGYSQVVTAGAPSRLVVISGQIALDASGALVGPGDLAAQTRQVFTNLGLALDAAGAGWEHLVKLSYFVRDVTRVADVRTVRDQFLPEGVRPASTLVEVSALFRDDLLIEIEALAAVPA